MSAPNLDTSGTNQYGQPIGHALPGWTPRRRPEVDRLPGRWCSLEHLDVARHAEDLYSAYSAAPDDSDWTYLPAGPFVSAVAYREWAQAQAESADPRHYAVVDASTAKALGTLSLMRHDPANGAIEVGWVVFSRAMQRTPLSTEAHYLLMRHVFDVLGYRRYEWKCDSLNVPSRRAAERLGFIHEGTFRRATVYKGRNRDTSWYSIIDREPGWRRATSMRTGTNGRRCVPGDPGTRAHEGEPGTPARGRPGEHPTPWRAACSGSGSTFGHVAVQSPPVGTGLSQHYRFRYYCDVGDRVKYRQVVREIALDQYGYVTTRDAARAGVPAVELPKLAARGGLENVAYGLYRVPDIPPTRYDQFAEALLRVGDGACLHGESVLALFGLGDVNPRRIKVAVRRRTRPKLPAFIELTKLRDDVPTTLYEGLASQPVADALLECRGRIEPEGLLAAAKQARDEGLLTAAEWQRVREGID